MFEKKRVEHVNEPVKPKKREAKPRSSGSGIKTIVIPLFLAAVIVFLLYLAISFGVSSGDKVTCYTAKEDIPANTYVKDYEEYFESNLVDSNVVPDNAIKSDFPKSFYTVSKMDKHQMVLEDDIVTSNAKVEGIDKTTDVTGISVKDFNFAVGGTLRAGDLIDIYAPNEETDMLEPQVEDILIKEAFDSTGNKITDEGVAIAFNIFVPQDKAEAVNRALSLGDIQLYNAK